MPGYSSLATCSAQSPARTLHPTKILQIFCGQRWGITVFCHHARGVPFANVAWMSDGGAAGFDILDTHAESNVGGLTLLKRHHILLAGNMMVVGLFGNIMSIHELRNFTGMHDRTQNIQKGQIPLTQLPLHHRRNGSEIAPRAACERELQMLEATRANLFGEKKGLKPPQWMMWPTRVALPNLWCIPNFRIQKVCMQR